MKKTPAKPAITEDTPITLREFLDLQPKGEASRLAAAIGTHRGTISALANGYVFTTGPRKGRRKVCSGRVARAIGEYGKAKGHKIKVAELCGLGGD